MNYLLKGMMLFTALILASINGSAITTNCSGKGEVKVCELASYSPNGHSLWLPGLNGVTQDFHFVLGTSKFQELPNGKAIMTGLVQNEQDPTQQWKVAIWFSNKMDWSAWSSAGGDYKDEQGIVTNEYLNWDYYIMDTTKVSRLLGLGSLKGSRLNLTHMPSTYQFGFQVGEKANSKNSEYGMACWFYYHGKVNGQMVNGHGDVNVNSNCSPGVSISTPTVIDCNNPQVSLDATTGISGSSFNWSGPAEFSSNQSSPSVVRSGWYKVTVTSPEGCTSISKVRVHSNKKRPRIQGSIIEPTCNGNLDGSITTSIISPTGPHTYIWSTGETTPDLYNLGKGKYRVTVTGTNGCSVVKTFRVRDAKFQARVNSTRVSCYGGNDGTVSLLIRKGVAPYTYLWSNGETTKDLNGLIAGVYTVTVTDANGCTTAGQRMVRNGKKLLVKSKIVQPTCESPLGNINVIVRSSQLSRVTSYEWSNGQTTNHATNLLSGEHILTITYDDGCTLVDTFILNDLPCCNVTAAGEIGNSQNGCGGFDPDPIVSISLPIGGAGALEYVWLQREPGQPFSVINGANGPTYDPGFISTTMEYRRCARRSSCSAYIGETNWVTMMVNNACIPAPSTPNCNAGNFLWENDIDVTTLSGSYGIPQATLRMKGGGVTEYLIPGPYPNAFSGNVIVNIDEVISWDAYLNRGNVGNQPHEQWRLIFKKNGQVVYTSDYTADLITGQTSTEWIGSLGSGINLPNGTDEILIAHYENSTYGNGSAPSANSVVPVSVCISYEKVCDNVTSAGEIGNSQSGCVGFDPDPITSISLPSGGAGTMEYVWLQRHPGQPFSVISGANGSAYDPGAISATTEFRRCARRSNCTAFVGESNWITMEVQTTGCNECFGFRTQTQGGWGTKPAGNNPGVYRDQNFSGAFPNGLVIGCNNKLILSNSNAVKDFLPSGGPGQPLPNGIMIDPNNYKNVLAGQLVAATLSVGFDNYDPNFSSSNVLLKDLEFSSGPFATMTISEVIDLANEYVGGCNSAYSASELVDALSTFNENYVDGSKDQGNMTCPSSNEELLAEVTSTSPNCSAENGVLTASATGGVAPYSYAWSNGETTPTITSNISGSYQVTVNDANGSEAWAQGIISIPSPILLNGNAINPFCNGEEAMLSVSATGGTGTYSYQWSSGSTNSMMNTTIPGVYDVTVTDENGCFDEISVIADIPAAIETSATLTNPLCSGDEGTISISSAGGTAPYSYLWSNGSNGTLLTTAVTGNYMVTVLDASGCTNEFTYQLEAPLPIELTAMSTSPLCANEEAQVSANATGGSGLFSYSWSTSATTATTIAMTSGTYSVTATDENGCSEVTNTTVTIPTEVTTSVSAQNALCPGGTTTLNASATGGTGSYNFNWSNGSSGTTTSTIVGGTFIVTATDENGCTDIKSVEAIVPEPIALNLVGVDESGFFSFDGAVYSNPTGGTPVYSFIWSNGATTQNITGLAGYATYAVTITDQNGCTESDSIYINGGFSSKAGRSIQTSHIQSTQQIEVNIYPNPAILGNEITICLVSSVEDERMTVEIMDMSGKSLMQKHISVDQGANSIPLTLKSSVASGQYLVITTIGEERKTKLIQVIE